MKITEASCASRNSYSLIIWKKVCEQKFFIGFTDIGFRNMLRVSRGKYKDCF